MQRALGEHNPLPDLGSLGGVADPDGGSSRRSCELYAFYGRNAQMLENLYRDAPS